MYTEQELRKVLSVVSGNTTLKVCTSRPGIFMCPKSIEA